MHRGLLLIEKLYPSTYKLYVLGSIFFIAGASPSVTDVNTKYQQQQANNLGSLTFFK